MKEYMNETWQCEHKITRMTVCRSQPSAKQQYAIVSVGQEASFDILHGPPSALKDHQRHNDPSNNIHFAVSTASKIHLPLSICGTFSHPRSITYDIKKRITKGNDCESDIDRVW
jgi:hypothetical protein